jgi:hypothetical protein
MIVSRVIGIMVAVLVGVSAIGCATTSVPRDALGRPAGPTPVQVDPSQIYNDPLQAP